MRTLVRGVNEVRAVILVPLVLAEPLLRSIAIPFHALVSMEDILAFAGAVFQIQSSRVSAYFGAIAKLAIIGSRASRDFRPSLVRVLAHDVARGSVVADESVFVTAAAASDVGTTHASALRPHQLSIMTTLGHLAVFIAHWVACLSCKIVTLSLVVPKLHGPHKPFNRSRIAVPEKDVLSDWILFEVPEWIGLVP